MSETPEAGAFAPGSMSAADAITEIESMAALGADFFINGDNVSPEDVAHRAHAARISFQMNNLMVQAEQLRGLLHTVYVAAVALAHNIDLTEDERMGIGNNIQSLVQDWVMIEGAGSHSAARYDNTMITGVDLSQEGASDV